MKEKWKEKKITKMKNGEELKKYLRKERFLNPPICESGDGVYLPKSFQNATSVGEKNQVSEISNSTNYFDESLRANIFAPTRLTSA